MAVIVLKPIKTVAVRSGFFALPEREKFDQKKVMKTEDLRFGLKSAILGSAVYYTIDKGVWKDSATTSALYKDLEDGVSPYVGEMKKQIPYELPPLPTNDRVTYLFKYYWNSGVKATFRFLIELPTHASDAASKTYQMAASAFAAVESSASPQQSVEK